MARRRRSRLCCFNCDRSSSEDYYPPPWPRALPPRRIMENGDAYEINIFPTTRKFQVEQCLSARVDKKINCHLLSKRFVRSLGDPKMEYKEGIVTDSSGRVYECIGAIKATWRIEGYNNSELDYFIVVLGDFPDGVDVLLENSGRVRNSLGLCGKSRCPDMLPFFTSWETRKADKATRKATEERQEREAKEQEEAILKQQEQARQAQANNTATRNSPPRPTRARN